MNIKSFVAGFALAIALVASMGAIGGDSAEDKYLKACQAVQGEAALRIVDSAKIRDRDQAANRTDHYIRIMNEYKP